MSDDLDRLRKLAGITLGRSEKLAILLPEPSRSHDMEGLLDTLRQIWDEPSLQFTKVMVDGVPYVATAVHRDDVQSS